MKQMILKLIGLLFIIGSPQTFAAIASPIVADFGQVGGYLTNVSIPVSRSPDDAPWYVTFELMETANVAIGVLGKTEESTFYLTGLRLTKYSDDTQGIAFGTDDFTYNPFDPDPIDQLLFADKLAPNIYALAVSGYGDAYGTDFIAHLRVESVPLPATAWLFISALLGMITINKRKTI